MAQRERTLSSVVNGFFEDKKTVLGYQGNPRSRFCCPAMPDSSVVCKYTKIFKLTKFVNLFFNGFLNNPDREHRTIPRLLYLETHWNQVCCDLILCLTKQTTFQVVLNIQIFNYNRVTLLITLTMVVANIAPEKARKISFCASHTSPWVPR